MTERYLQRSEILLRLIDLDDLGQLVEPEARAEICRVQHLPAEPESVCCEKEH